MDVFGALGALEALEACVAPQHGQGTGPSLGKELDAQGAQASPPQAPRNAICLGGVCGGRARARDQDRVWQQV